MPLNNLDALNATRWWHNKLWDFNKRLLIIGIAYFICCALMCAALYGLLMPLVLLGFAILYLAYIVIANIIFALGWIADVLMANYNDDIFHNAMFNIIYWVATLLPPGILLTMIWLQYLDAMFDFRVDL